ncbi:rteB, two-component system response regulator [Indibacter alkaliphilus LW1]|uniref:RteB, two-component system response regulator n=1 Tax=Indibacter alkaliphilus (strain CCUG 57479 / KCTC 22604 / LW1) TaxID=1189612 RepID=S2D2W0_INDAL|nr:sigma-54 dependent transcriptional regulator [Indibacter alkaliphilus]EOZ93637.1 rteB, two-component system response regulator [Indibacter alkaliphilus LW1]
MAKILVIDDNLDICNLLKRFLTKKGHDVETTLSGETGLEMVKKEKFDLILCDFKLRDIEGPDILQAVKEISPDTKLAIITGYSDVRVAVEVMKKGAFDYVVKPLIPDEILSLIDRAINTPTEKPAVVSKDTKHSESKITKTPKGDTEYIWGKDSASKNLFKEVSLVAPTNFSVIIYGESGAGKENIARTIHDLSERKDMPFIAIDCGALTRDLAGSELWGHEKGAFTGALASKAGQFELADGGTIFLDEIANLSYDIQVGLLRLVQEKKLRRIGGVKDKNIDVRIIVASNENLKEAVAKGKFREDLFYRFNEFTINVPPLRKRGKDIMLFASHFLEKANQELNKEVKGFSKEVSDLFNQYEWPGNLREMRNIIRRSLLLTDGEEVGLTAIPHEVVHAQKFAFKEEDPGIPENSHVAEHLQEEPADLKVIAANAEAEAIKKALLENQYNKTKAAKQLGIDRKTLFNKIKLHNIA